jgi:transposase InsO family protein
VAAHGSAQHSTQLAFLPPPGACDKLGGMKEQPGKGRWASPKALARYDAVRFVEEALKSGLPLRRALCRASERLWGDRCYGASTIEDWYYHYRHHGLAGLEDIPRKDKGRVRALSPETLDAFLSLRREQPGLHATTLLRQLEDQGVVAPRSVSMSTLYRALAREGLDRRSLRAGSAMLKGPSKAFEFSWANQLWMSDGMWGPWLPVEAGGKPVRTHLLALLDDCSRLCAHGQYYTAERIECFLDLLKQALCSRGIPEKLYTDNGALFTSEHLKSVCANFGIRLIHAKPYAAWSKGKIERFFLTVQSDFEQRLVFSPVADLAELNQRFWRWLEREYNQRAHRALERQSPQQRFADRSEGLRPVPEGMDVDALFLLRTRRRVRRDATISIAGTLWEVPPACRGRKVDVHYDPFRWTRVELYVDGRKVGDAKRCDKQLNARSFGMENYERD